MANQQPRYKAFSPAAILIDVNLLWLDNLLRTFNIIYIGITDGIKDDI